MKALVHSGPQVKRSAAPRHTINVIYPELNQPPVEQHGGGRPTKFTPPILRRVLRCARRGMPLTLAAKAVGVSTLGLLNYRKANPRFEEALNRAIASGVDARLKKIEQAADAKDWRAAAWLLEHLMPEHFAKNRLEVSGPDGAPLVGGVILYLPRKDGATVEAGPALDSPALLPERSSNGNGG